MHPTCCKLLMVVKLHLIIYSLLSQALMVKAVLALSHCLIWVMRYLQLYILLMWDGVISVGFF